MWEYPLRKHHRLSDKIRPIITPLIEAFDIAHFCYFYVDEKGMSACLSSHPQWVDILSYEVELEKPDPQIYQLLLKAVPFAPGEIVFIDDKLENVESAKKQGIDAFVFESLDQVRSELKKRGLL